MRNLLQTGSMLSLDIGRSRIGLAGCDSTGITITTLPPLYRRTIEEDLLYLNLFIINRYTVGLVVGIPLDDLNKITSQSIHCRRYGKKLAKKLNLPVAWVNENSSTWSATERYDLVNDRSGHLDSMVAYILLEQWLRERCESQSIPMINTSMD
uniref:Holliday junction resolvase YqgF n=1 Tax=Paulinella longichromatophora TaxID=1708747 RepID=A0A2H4ZP28_9EUKA|nr:Holliday junction resolvase YqgF [Paulinella longichromatophora]